MFKTVLTLVLLAASPVFAQPAAPEGILLLAHGGSADWNARVLALASTIDHTRPVEVAFGMASRPAIQAAVDKLVERRVTSIVAVPLFISSHSSVVTSTAYLLGARQEMPADLKIFARMRHGAPSGGGGHDHHGTADGAEENTKPISSPVPIRMTDALNHHPLVGEILIDRAREISTAPEQEVVIIVAHGPVPDEDNERWLLDMKALAAQMDAATDFAAIRYLTVRDDAPATIKDAATAELRTLVGDQIIQNRRVLVVPLLLSYGGIEKGIRQRLEGLPYVMAERALMPDARLGDWVTRAIQ
jgi:sirohydrochlorin ferrochelatase